MATKSSVEHLNGFLRGELSAVETYRMAVDKFDALSPTRLEIESCMASHQERVNALREAIIALGGTPAEDSGTWGMFARVVERAAKLFGQVATIDALEEGEDHGLHDYRDEADEPDLDLQSRTILTARLLPAQQAAHDRMTALKHAMH